MHYERAVSESKGRMVVPMEQSAESTPASHGASDWITILQAEYEALYGSKPFEYDAPPDRHVRLHALHLLLHERRPTALCLSGGGIRSASFGLGVLQSLARIGVLGKLDYLSTVSGGGYVGGWLTSWLARDPRSEVLQGLQPAQAGAMRGPEARLSPVNRLRAMARYLAPQGGLLSADMWTLLATMGRNLLLNWFVLLPLLAGVLLVPRIYLATVSLVEQNVIIPPGQPCLPADAAPFWLALISMTMFVVAIGYVVMNFVGHGNSWSQGRFLSFVVAPTLVGTIGLTLFWSAYPCAPNEADAIFVSAVLPAAGWLVIGALARPSLLTLLPPVGAAALASVALFWSGWSLNQPPHLAVAIVIPLLLIGAAAFNRNPQGRGAQVRDRAVRMRAGARTVAAALVAGPIVGFGSYWFARKYFYFGDPLGESYAVFAVPGILLLMLLANTTFIGLASGELTDAALEWWNRFAAWLAIAAALWLAAGVLVFYLADFVELAVQGVGAALQIEHHTSSTIFSVLIPFISSMAGLAARAGGVAGQPSRLRLALQRVALPITIIALLATVAWFNAWALRGFKAPGENGGPAGLGEVVLLALFQLSLGLLMSRFVPVNRFSLHGMYRQRLVRTFLGASHTDRHPNAFTGFDPADDLCVHQLAAVRPLHVINATLNNVSQTNYGRNERKAYAFTFSPLHVGSSALGYRASSKYGSDGGGPATGLSLGMALAVSGAAASPAMGMYTSHARAFLLTLANARLGLWFGNPKNPVSWQRSDPKLSVGPIVRELLGLATDTNPYVYLSDGGHFENLGLWSMVVRRCGAIIVSDAGCDPDYTFEDLSNAVRRIRIDLGIPIEFDAIDMSRSGQGISNRHVAVGTIRYSAVDGPGTPDGVLLYFKATLSGDESVDIRTFAALNSAFPHDPTGNQFFDEDRFESYRALGYHSIMSVAGKLTDADVWNLAAAVTRATHSAGFARPATV
jgi:Patatin-like phospholipase